MSPNVKAVAAIEDWPGLFTSSGPSSSGKPPGTAEMQDNLECVKPGQLSTRQGLVPVQFEDEE